MSTDRGERLNSRQVCVVFRLSPNEFAHLQLMHGFPSPVHVVGGRYYWNREQIAEWLKRHPSAHRP